MEDMSFMLITFIGWAALQAKNTNALSGRAPPERAVLCRTPTESQELAEILWTTGPMRTTFDGSFLSRAARSCQAFWGALLAGMRV